MTEKAQVTKGKLDKQISKFKTSVHPLSEKATHKTGENFANHLSDNDLVSRICKKFLQLYNKKTTQFKHRPKIYISPKGINIYIHIANKHMTKSSTSLCH